MRTKLVDWQSWGRLMVLAGSLVASPLVILPFYPNEITYAGYFAWPAALSVVLGLLLTRLCEDMTQPVARLASRQQSSLTVLFAWLWGILLGALPFVFSGQLNFLQGIFEATSGWTTTGLSVLDVTKVNHLFLFHRSFMQFCGGMGFITMMLMLVGGQQAMDLFNAEGHPDKLMPNLKKTARTVCAMFCFLLIIGTLAYLLAGMNLFESICHTMCALSTGGFSNRLNSIGEYQSLAIDVITILLMLVGTTNFAVLLLLGQRKVRRVWQVSEVRFMLAALVIIVPLTGLSLWQQMGMSLGEGMHHACFDIVSALSTTGYASMAYDKWPPVAISMMILVMLIGGGIGSTAGGLKLTRVYLLLRQMQLTVRGKFISGRRIETPTYVSPQGKTIIDEALLADTTGFCVCYLLLFGAGSVLMTVAADCNLTQAMFEFASALGTAGLSIGLTGPDTRSPVLLLEIVGMLFGRLEIFIILVGIEALVKKIRA